MKLEKIGVFSNSYLYNDDYAVNEEPGSYSIDEIFEGISKAGFKFVELLTESEFSHIVPKLYDMDDKYAAEFKNKLSKYNLSINGIYYYQGQETLLTDTDGLCIFQKLLDGCRLLSSKFLITDTDYMDDGKKQKMFYKTIGNILDYAASRDVILCLDVHGPWCCNGKIAAGIIKNVSHPNLKINYCTGNAIYWGNTRPEDDIDYALPFLGRVHLKDSMGKPKDYNFPALGDGTIDFKKILLKLQDFRGPVSVEVELDGKNNSLDEINTAIVQSRSYLMKIMQSEVR
jgi:sugar phosphate isomerase/epimerase